MSLKNPVIAAVLALIFGPLGYLYINWRYAITSFVIFFIFTAVIVAVNLPIPDWIKLVILPVLAWKAYTICAVYNAMLETEDENINSFRSFPIAVFAMTDLLIGIALAYAVSIGLYIGVHLLINGNILKGIAMVILGTPLLAWVANLVFGFIAVAIDAIFQTKAENIFRN